MIGKLFSRKNLIYFERCQRNKVSIGLSRILAQIVCYRVPVGTLGFGRIFHLKRLKNCRKDRRSVSEPTHLVAAAQTNQKRPLQRLLLRPSVLDQTRRVQRRNLHQNRRLQRHLQHLNNLKITSSEIKLVAAEPS